MGFWQNVERELEYTGVSKKELAILAKTTYTNICSSIKRNSMPGADTAVRIAKALGVSLEYLLVGEDTDANPKGERRDLALLGKYKEHIKCLESLPDDVREPVIDMVRRLAKK